MYYFKFNKHKTLNHDPNKRYSVYEAIKYMNEVHKERQFKERPAKLAYKIYEEGNREAYLSDVVILGEQTSFEFFDYVRSRFRKVYHDNEKTLIKLNNFLVRLEEQYNQELIDNFEEENNITPLEQTETIKEDEFTESSFIDDDIDFAYDEFEEPEIEEKPKLKKQVQKTKKINLKPLIVLVAVSIVVFFGAKNINFNSTARELSYEEMMAEEEYIEAAKSYPDHLDEIEREIFMKGSEGIDELKELNKIYPEYLPGQFDLAYLEQNYNKVVDLKDQADSIGRKAQLAIAYIQLGNLEEAEKLNAEILNEEISKLIQEGYATRTIGAIKNNDLAQAKEYQVKSNNHQLLEVINSIEALDNKIKDLEDQDKEKNKEEIQKLQEEKNKIVEKL